MLHDSVFLSEPVQPVPPFLGAGFVQVRVFVLVPPPQDLEHGPYDDHGERPPLTEK